MLVVCLHNVIRDRAFAGGRQAQEAQQRALMEIYRITVYPWRNKEGEQEDERWFWSRYLSFLGLGERKNEDSFDDLNQKKNDNIESLYYITDSSSTCSDSEETIDTSSVFSEEQEHEYYQEKPLLRSCLAPPRRNSVIRRKRSVRFAADRYSSSNTFLPSSTQIVLEAEDINRLWYSKTELHEIRREMLAVHAPSVVSSPHNSHASSWWKALFYFQKPKHSLHGDGGIDSRGRLLMMRAKLVVAYLQAEEIVGLERILLSLLNNGYAGPRASLLEWLQQRRRDHRPPSPERIAAHQQQVSSPFCRFAREIALAQADALAMMQMQEQEHQEAARNR